MGQVHEEREKEQKEACFTTVNEKKIKEQREGDTKTAKGDRWNTSNLSNK